MSWRGLRRTFGSALRMHVIRAISNSIRHTTGPEPPLGLLGRSAPQRPAPLLAMPLTMPGHTDRHSPSPAANTAHSRRRSASMARGPLHGSCDPLLARRPRGDKVAGMRSARFHPFPQTHWSLIRRAGGVDAANPEERREALSRLLARYEPALKSYLRLVRRMPAGEADDLLQTFITDRLLEHQLLGRAGCKPRAVPVAAAHQLKPLCGQPGRRGAAAGDGFARGAGDCGFRFFRSGARGGGAGCMGPGPGA